MFGGSALARDYPFAERHIAPVTGHTPGVTLGTAFGNKPKQATKP